MTDGTSDLPEQPEKSTWLEENAGFVVMTVLLLLLAFFAGRYTSHLDLGTSPSTPVPDPCTAILESFEKVDDGLSSNPDRKARAISHYVADHPDCFPPDVVAQAKALLDEMNAPAGQPLTPERTFGAPLLP